MTISYARDDVGLAIFDIGAFLDKTKSPEGKGFKFKLHEENPKAPLSPSYLDLRTPNHPTKPGLLTPEIVGRIADNHYGLARRRQLKYDCVSSVPYAGDPFANAFAKVFFSRTGRKLPIIKLGKKEAREKREVTEIIDGAWEPGWTALLIDDLVTQAHSKLESIGALKREGLVVEDVLVFVDREQGGREELNRKGYNLHAVFLFSELMELYLQKGKISPEMHKEIMDYLANY